MGATETATDSNDDPWPGVDATHLTGDLYFVDRYPQWYWLVSSLLCVIVPPVGVGALAFMIASGIVTEDEELDVELQD